MADKPEGPYIKTPGRIFEAEKPGKHWMVAEDPFIWFSKKYGRISTNVQIPIVQ